MAEAQPASLLHLHRFDRTGEDAGAYHHRVLQPVEMLHDCPEFAPAELSWLDPGAPGHALAADLLVVHALAGPEIEILLRERWRQGRPTLFEIGDDLSAPRPWSRRVHARPNAMTVARQCLHASRADAVQFSSLALQAKYATLNANTTVLDNAVAFPGSAPHRPAGFVFGWAGTRSHHADLAAIAPAVAAFCTERPDTQFALMGDATLAQLFSAVPPGQFRWQPFGSYAAYRAFLGTLHVGLVPIGAGAFARGRSDVKAVEMAAEGAVVLAQSAAALAGLPAILPRFEDGGRLVALLDKLHADPRCLAALARGIRETLRSERDLPATCARHRQWYRSWRNAATGALPIVDRVEAGQQLDAAQECAAAGARDDALAQARALLLSDPSYAQARWLAAGLLAERGQRDEALALGAPLQACPIYRHVWSDYVAALRDGREAALPADAAAHADFHRTLLDAHPFHPFALAAEEYRLRQAGDAAGAAALRARRMLLGDEA